MPRSLRWRAAAEVRLLCLALLAGACAPVARIDQAAIQKPAPTVAPTVVAGGVTALPIPSRSALDGPYPRFRDAQSGLVTILGTPDLGTGKQRVSFVPSNAEGLVRLPVLQFESFRFEAGPTGASGPPVAGGIAKFYPFPADTRGLYVATVDFDRAGTWGLRVSVPQPDGTVLLTLFAFEVRAAAKAPAVGAPAPRSRNRTVASTPLAELSTGSTPDASLYQSTLADAIDARRPTVVVFASPGFCTNALCGPQVEMLSDLRGSYGDRAAFIHVELYENPSAVRDRGLDAAVRSPVLREWGLETDEWTFVIDADGAVAARFEGFAPREEVESALRAVLG
ncbi:MAG: hypothetical protein U0360_08985 [Dehalococcoidia bacterium]